MLQNGADANITYHHGTTLLHQAAFSLSCKAVNLLLKHRADPTQKSQDGCTPLFMAGLHLSYHPDADIIIQALNEAIQQKKSSEANSTTQVSNVTVEAASHLNGDLILQQI